MKYPVPVDICADEKLLFDISYYFSFTFTLSGNQTKFSFDNFYLIDLSKLTISVYTQIELFALKIIARCVKW